MTSYRPQMKKNFGKNNKKSRSKKTFGLKVCGAPRGDVHKKGELLVELSAKARPLPPRP